MPEPESIRDPAPAPRATDDGRATVLDGGAEERYAAAIARDGTRLAPRELLVEAIAAGVFLAAAIAVAALVHTDRSLDPALAALLVVAYAFAGRIKLQITTDHTTATQMLFVPMLFLLPLESVPLLVAAGNVLAETPDFVRGRPAQRVLLPIANSWYALGPVLVFLAAGITAPGLEDWPVLVAALAAQFAFDFTGQTLREWLGLGIAPRLQIVDAGWIYLVDALLSAIGLLAAIETADQRYLLLGVLPALGLLAIFAHERNARIESSLELRGAYRGTTILLAELLEEDDEYTAYHSHDVVSLTLEVCNRLELDRRRRLRAEFGALLHDIGKIAVPKEVLNKPGPLTDDEWRLIRVHTVEGQRMLERVGGLLSEVGRIVRASHERWDGKGYPDGLAGEQIPIEARIVACCDAFNAMTTDRPYRRALPLQTAIDEVRRNSGGQFDPTVADAVVAVARERQGAGAEAADTSPPLSVAVAHGPDSRA